MYPIEPPDPCEHDDNPRWCDICEEERSYAEDMAADAAYERWRLGE